MGEWHGPPSPLPSLSHDALRGSGYIGQARSQDATPSFEFVLSDFRRYVVNKKNLGFPGQFVERWRRGGDQQKSWSGANACRKTMYPDVCEEGGSVEDADSSSRGGLHGTLFEGNAATGKWAP